jgi:hypothetical protein
LWVWLCLCACHCIPLQPPCTCVSHAKALISNESYYTFWAECLHCCRWLEKSALEGEVQLLKELCKSYWSVGSHCGLSIEGVSKSVTYWHWNMFV